MIELLVVISLLGLVLAGVSELLSTTLSGTAKSSSLQSVKENGQFAMTTIERTVRRANDVTSCSSGPTGGVGVTLRELGGSFTYTFQLSGSALLKYDSSSGETVPLLGSDVEVDDFFCELTPRTALTPELLKLRLTVSKPGFFDTQALGQTFETSVQLRSY